MQELRPGAQSPVLQRGRCESHAGLLDSELLRQLSLPGGCAGQNAGQSFLLLLLLLLLVVVATLEWTLGCIISLGGTHPGSVCLCVCGVSVCAHVCVCVLLPV